LQIELRHLLWFQILLSTGVCKPTKAPNKRT
jgi:hypothetical protein